MKRNVLHTCVHIIEKISSRTLVISRTWVRNKVVFHWQRPGGKWDRVLELMMIKFRESGHPVFRATSPLSRGTLKSKGGGKLATHFCADGWTIETVFRTIISVDQLSIYGAVSDGCEEYSSCQTSTGRLVVAVQSDSFLAPADLMYWHTTLDWDSCTRFFFAEAQRTRGKNSTEDHLEKRMKRSNSGDWKMIFRTNLSTLNIGLMMYGRTRW